MVDGQSTEYKNLMSDLPQERVLDPLHFILLTHDIWFEVENM